MLPLVVLISLFGACNGTKAERPEAKAIREVLASLLIESQEFASRDQTDYTESAREYVVAISETDTSNCPPDFQDAYDNYVYAWHEVVKWNEDAEGLSGFVKSIKAYLTMGTSLVGEAEGQFGNIAPGVDPAALA